MSAAAQTTCASAGNIARTVVSYPTAQPPAINRLQGRPARLSGCFAGRRQIGLGEDSMRSLQILGVAEIVAPLRAGSPLSFADDPGWYVGVNAGPSRDRFDDSRIGDDLLGGGFGMTSINRVDRHFGFKAFGAYQFDKYFALEGRYFNLGQSNFTADTLPAGSLRDLTKLQGVNFDAVGMAPIGDRFTVFGRIGVNYADLRDSVATVDSVAMRIEAERYRITDPVGPRGNVDLPSVGLIYRFGAPAPLPRPAPPAPPAPAPAVVAAPPMRQRVQFSADSLFTFDKATVKPAGRRALDAFARQLVGATFKVIAVTGYTDRLGAHAYNMRLSARRAAEVKAYLVQTAGITEDKIVARGADGSDPVTKPGECWGTRPTAILIASPQPDRRVEVDVERPQAGDSVGN
ncbi:MAG: OmpA family protein [Steroidobacteraceae bacterium]